MWCCCGCSRNCGTTGYGHSWSAMPRLVLRFTAWNVEPAPGRVVVRCTLLGPEATRRRANSPGSVFVSGVVFENCRVDASIFVVKLLRAHGGCLGFRSR